MNMDEINVLEELFDNKIISIIKFILENQEKELYLQEIAEKSNVAPATGFRILQKLEKSGIIESRKIGKIKIYKVLDNKKTKLLSELFKEDKRIIQLFSEQIREIENVEAVILHGKEQKDKANILILGENIDPDKIKRICGEIKEKYKFNISALTLTREQYMQMTQMGLYSGEKRVLFERI